MVRLNILASNRLRWHNTFDLNSNHRHTVVILTLLKHEFRIFVESYTGKIWGRKNSVIPFHVPSLRSIG